MSQLWAERKRRILCILPAALRPQWSQELLQKFFIDSIIIESASYNQFLKQGMKNPFEQESRVVLCSYQFARSKELDVRAVYWDLVVVDEAHRLRNVYKKSNKIARSIRDAIGSRPKVLLTATPLQNSLMELYGLISFIDPHLFGSEETFREQFARNGNEMSAPEFGELRGRLRPICQRTLRRQVVEYIRYTNRVSITQDFTPTDDELALYEAVSNYLQRPESYALPSRQRSLMTLVLRKILASSSFAIAATLGALITRLEEMHRHKGGVLEQANIEMIEQDFETVAEMQDEWRARDEELQETPVNGEGSASEQEKTLLLNAIRKEADELKNYRELAESIAQNAKGEALLIALKTGFKMAADLRAPRKSLIFTESRRTQQYLFELLAANGYSGEVVTFNGTNNEPQCKAIYKNWRERHKADDMVSGSPSADMRSALVEEFRERAAIMIATESGAEGVNLQFCSLVVNYDLPWNPQRIEQRIGRCHRYGQQHDVVVINFLNRKNAADQRVFELLKEKLHLFDGVFGASDEVLGALESGVDFERRVNDIYQTCRTPHEINTAFDRLQAELVGQIRARMEDTRAKLFEHFDQDVHRRLRNNRDETAQQMNRFEDWLWRLTEFELNDDATFGSSDDYLFHLNRLPEGLDAEGISVGPYRLVTRKSDTLVHQYRIGHPLAERLIAKAKSRSLPIREIVFRYDQHPKSKKISLVENLQGKSGW
ncbi:MAG: SNF2-related protein, partial [candidate division KSB1 bacterium]